MCESKEREGLPLLPGLTFLDPTKCVFHKNQFLGFKNGIDNVKTYALDCGRYPRDIDSVRYHICDDDVILYDPSLTYGRVKEVPFAPFRPHFVNYDSKCLNFKAFFKQGIFDSPDEYFRVHHVNILYYLDDDTLTVMEPPIENAGFPQGRLVRRGKIPKYGYEGGETIHWKDLNIGIDIMIQGLVFHTVDCDLFTKEFLISQGVELNDAETLPPDPYIELRKAKAKRFPKGGSTTDDKLRRFLEYGGRALKFRAVWDDRDTEHGELGSYCIKYYLDDDTVEVGEIHERNSGKDPFPLLLKRTRLPKDWTDTPDTWPSIYMERGDPETTEYYQPKDFIIGNTIFVFGRRMLLHKCNKETRHYYCTALNIKQPPDFEVFEPPKPPPVVPPPPVELRIGTLEDSYETCRRIVVKPPKRDELKLILNAGKYLRYSAKLKTTHSEDEIREFVIFYGLGDSMIKIMEPRVRNSGHVGGKFLSSILVPKPGTHPDFPVYYSPTDFYIGAIIDVFGHKFEITGADKQVYRYMEANPEKFKPEYIDNVRNYLMREGLLNDDVQTVARAMVDPLIYETSKTCRPAEPCEEHEMLHPCKEAWTQPCKPDPDYEPKKDQPPECLTCPDPLPCGKVPEECKTTDVPEIYFDDLSGKMVFNRENPKWK